MRMIGGSTGMGGVGPGDGPRAGLSDEPPPQAAAAMTSALVTNVEKIFRGQ
jgi:hypothetical protein